MSNAKMSIVRSQTKNPEIEPGQFGVVHVKGIGANISRFEGLIVVCNDNNELFTIGSTTYRSDFKHLVGKGWQKSTLEKVEIEILPSGTEILIKIN